ncbi:ABC transporter substrate-binding protein [Isachenkonia alkalipeptolytica]
MGIIRKNKSGYRRKISSDTKASLLLGMVLIVTAFFVYGCEEEGAKDLDLKTMSWEEILEEAEGTQVNFYGWGGDQAVNNWINGFLAHRMMEKYDITLEWVPMNIDEILNKLQGEKQAEALGTVDMIWINGENFFTAKTNDLLYGPFTDALPNFNHYIDDEDVEVQYDFGFPTEGYEAPFGKAQFVMIYDEEKTPNPPTSHEALLAYAKEHPGEITFPAPPDFTGSVFIRNIIYDIVGHEQFLEMEADEDLVREAIKPAMEYFKELKPYLWREGKTYPATIAQLENMYADGEVRMVMAYNSNLVSQRISSGVFPETSASVIFHKGTIGNGHFIGVPFNSPNLAGALVTINEILTPEVQASKYEPANWGDLPVLDNDKLSEEEQEIFEAVKLGEGVLPQEVLLDNRLPEVPAPLVPLIDRIWMETILG